MFSNIHTRENIGKHDYMHRHTSINKMNINEVKRAKGKKLHMKPGNLTKQFLILLMKYKLEYNLRMI